MVRGSFNAWFRRACSGIGGLEESVRWEGTGQDSGCREKVFTARRGPTQDVADETTLLEIDEGKIHIQAFLPSRTWNETYYGHAIKVRWGFRAAFACAHCNAVF